MRGGALKILLPVVAVLAGLVLYQDVYLKSAGSLADLKGRVAAEDRALRKYSKLVSEAPAFRKKLAAVKAERLAAVTELFEGQSLSIAGSYLMADVKTIVSGCGGTIASESEGMPKPLGKYHVVSARFQMTLPDTDALTNVLYQIETHEPAMTVKKMHVQRLNINDPRALTARLEVASLAVLGETQAANLPPAAGGPFAAPLMPAPAPQTYGPSNVGQPNGAAARSGPLPPWLRFGQPPPWLRSRQQTSGPAAKGLAR